jgi:glycine cleavage system regulatory protein
LVAFAHSRAVEATPKEKAVTTALVLTLIGVDRPGLVEAVSEAVLRHDGNWLESRLARLAGKFAGVVLVSVPESEVDALSADLAALSEKGLRVAVEPTSEESDLRSEVLQLEIVGHDRPGIVKEIAQLLASHGVNVEDLTTHATSAPMSGYVIFQARARLSVPPGLDVEKLTRSIEEVANDLMVDVHFGVPPIEGK